MFPIVGPTERSGDMDERQKIDAFEMWCWRRMCRMSWMERKLMYGCSKTSRMDTGIEGGTSSFKILWTCGERGTRDGE